MGPPPRERRRTAGASARLGGLERVGLRTAEEEGERRDRDEGEQRRGQPEVHRAREAQRDRPGPHEAAEHRARGPHRVEGVQDRAAVTPLHPQPVGVLRHVGDGIHRPEEEQRRRERREGGGETDRERADPGEDGADDSDPGRPEAADQHAGRQTRHERADRQGGDREAVRGVREVEVVLDAGIAREHVREDRAVRQEERSHGDPRAAERLVWGGHRTTLVDGRAGCRQRRATRGRARDRYADGVVPYCRTNA